MKTNTRQERVEHDLRTLLELAGLPGPDDVALMEKAVIFLWYDSKAFLLVDLDGVPPGTEPLEGLDLESLRADILGLPLGPACAEAG
jgi:hypothetical protein